MKSKKFTKEQWEKYEYYSEYERILVEGIYRTSDDGYADVYHIGHEAIKEALDKQLDKVIEIIDKRTQKYESKTNYKDETIELLFLRKQILNEVKK